MQEYIIEEIYTKSNGEKETRQYSKGNLLGKGSQIECYELINLENKKVSAAKVYPKTKLKKAKLKAKLKPEVKIQSKLKHNNILKFEHFFEDPENIYVLFELCSNKTLKDLLRRRKRLTEIESQCYLLQLISALKYLHGQKIIHRDLRLENLFLNEKLELKLGGFEFASKIEFDGERKTSICGVPNFKAPEAISGSYSYEADIWSLGVILYTLLVGRPPFHSEHSSTIYSKIKSGNFSYPDNINISEASKELIERILVVDHLQRPGLDQILENDFFHQGHSIPKTMPLSTLVAPPSEPRNNSRRATTPKKSEKMTQEQFRANVKMQGNVFSGFGADGEVFVKKWIDYTSKYGLGYLLSNGNCGVAFIDSTRMILNSTTSQVFYMEKSGSEKFPIVEYSLNDYPEEIKKKITLLQYFKAYLETDTEISLGEYDNKLPIYVKKMMNTRHALIFRLSNRSVQVNFSDHSELTLNCDLKVVTFANRKGEKIKLPLNKAIQSNNLEIKRRLKYTRDAIRHMIKFN